MVEYENDGRLRQCLEACLTVILNKLRISEDQRFDNPLLQLSNPVDNDLLVDIKYEIEVIFNDRFPRLLKNSRRYLLNFLHDYDYDYHNRTFNTDLTTQSLKDLVQGFQEMIASLDAFHAVWTDKIDVVENFIKKYPNAKDKTGLGGFTLLYLAAQINKLNLTKYLIDTAGCSVNARNRKQTRQLHLSLLLDDGDDALNSTEGATALHGACANGHYDMVKFLVEHGADSFIENQAGETSIVLARPYSRIVQYLNESKGLKTPVNSVKSMQINNDDSYAEDGVWEYNPLSDRRWFRFSGTESKMFRKALIIKSNEKFEQEVQLKYPKGTYGIAMVSFLRSGKNLNYTEGLAWIRCRGSSLTNFKCYSWWQIMFQTYPSAAVNPSTRMKKLPNSLQPDFKIQCNQWYFVDNQINQIFDDAMKNPTETLKLNLSVIPNNELSFDMKEFTLTNKDRTITGFIRWIPKLISNDSSRRDQIIDIDHFEMVSEVDVTPLTISRYKQIIG